MTLLLRFHRDDSAQISFLAVAGVVCFVGLLSMVINTDDVITDRVHMQDIADTTSISAAAWTARGLNMIAFINVMNSKLISTAVLMNALADSVKAIRVVGEIQRGIFQACSGVPFIGAFCAAYAAVLSVQVSVLTGLERVTTQLADNLSRCGSKEGALWKVMNALQKAAKVVKETFTAIGMLEAMEMAKANGADMGIVVNGKLFDKDSVKELLSLPVTDEAGFKAFCPFVANGGSGYKMAGYKCGTGPFKLGRDRIKKTIMLPFINLFSTPIFHGMASAHLAKIGCPPDPNDADEKFKVFLQNLTECRDHDAVARWSHLYSLTGPLTNGNLTVQHFAPWKPLKPRGKGADKAPDQGQIEGQLGQINVPPEAEDDFVKTEATMGPNYKDLIKESEREGNNESVQVACDGPMYPGYSAPSDGLGSAQPGELSFLPICYGGIGGSQCRPITEWEPFRWYSANHVPNGPRDVGGYFIRVGKRTIEPPEDDKDAPTTYEYLVETVSLSDAGEKEMNMEEFEELMNKRKKAGQNLNTEASKGSESCTKPEPYMLDKGDTAEAQAEFQDKLRFMAVVWRDMGNDRPFWSNYFREPPEVLVAYSQAQVYNYLAEDTFTQDWRVRLEQSSLLEKLVQSGKLPGAATSKAAAAIAAINNH